MDAEIHLLNFSSDATDRLDLRVHIFVHLEMRKMQEVATKSFHRSLMDFGYVGLRIVKKKVWKDDRYL